MRAGLSVALFVLCSCTMMPLNKLVMRQLRHTPFTAVAGQMFGAASILACLPWTYQTTSDIYRCLVLPPLFATMLFMSMLSLQHASLGSIMAIRNTAPLAALPLEHCLVAPQHMGLRTVAALFFVLAGCVGYVWEDLNTSTYGVLLAGANMLVGVGDRLVQRHILSTTDVSKCSVLFVNNLLGGGIVSALAVATHEDATRAAYKQEVWIPWVLSVFVGLSLGYSGAQAQEHVSATTHLLISNLNRILVLLIGNVLLGEVVKWQQWVAICVSLGGTVMYSSSC